MELKPTRAPDPQERETSSPQCPSRDFQRGVSTDVAIPRSIVWAAIPPPLPKENSHCLTKRHSLRPSCANTSRHMLSMFPLGYRAEVRHLPDHWLSLNEKKRSPRGPRFFGTFQMLAVVRSPTTPRGSREGHIPSQQGPSQTLCRFFVFTLLTSTRPTTQGTNCIGRHPGGQELKQKDM